MITPTDIRNELHAHIQHGMKVMQVMVWERLGQHGPCTTRQLAEFTGISIFTVRPRVTELLELGLAELCGREGREGVYRQVALTSVTAELAREADARGEQRELF